MNTEKTLSAIDLFINDFEKYYESINSYILDGNIKGLVILNSLLPNELSCIEIEASHNTINLMNIEGSNGIVEYFISPKTNKDNIAVMDELRCRCTKEFPNSRFMNYRAFNYNMPFLKEIEHKALKITVPYDAIGYQGSISYNDKCKPLLNIIIVVKKPYCDKILIKKRVVFNNGEDNNSKKTSERMVWFQNKNNIVDLYLLNAIGEYNLTNHVGYIEILPEDAEVIVDGSVFTELADLRNEIKIIEKRMNYKYCAYCQALDIVMPINKYENKYYCSDLCNTLDNQVQEQEVQVQEEQVQEEQVQQEQVQQEQVQEEQVQEVQVQQEQVQEEQTNQ